MPLKTYNGDVAPHADAEPLVAETDVLQRWPVLSKCGLRAARKADNLLLLFSMVDHFILLYYMVRNRTRLLMASDSEASPLMA